MCVCVLVVSMSCMCVCCCPCRLYTIHVFSVFSLSACVSGFTGLVIAVEHRFYGESVPKDGLSSKLEFLTVEQALADLVAIINAYNEKDPGRKWIACGGSYSGALVGTC